MEKKPQRSPMGKIIKWMFILFNIGMLIWLIGGVSDASSHIDTIKNEDEKAGAEIGTGIGALVIIFIWVAGDIILGMLTYFTRAKRS
jgi:hypothetical protein